MTRPSDWWVLDLGSDPTPGDPVTIRSMARSWGGLADDAEYAEGKLRALIGDEAIGKWVGEAGDAFREKTGDLPGQLGKCKNSYRQASDALTWWAGRLEVHQGDADRALVKGRAARADLEAAQAAASVASGGVESAAGSSVLATARKYADSSPPAGVELPSESAVRAAQQRLSSAQAAARSADAAVVAAQSRLDAARQLALEASSLRVADAKTAAGRIREASDAGIPERSRWEKFKDWAAEAWDVIIKIAKIVVAVLGIVALIIGGPLAWVVFAAALLVLADTIMKYLKGQASLWDVALAALGAIPGVRGLTTLGGLKSLLTRGGGALRAMAAGLRSGLGRRTVVTVGQNVAKFKTRGGLTVKFEMTIKETFKTSRTSADKALQAEVGKLGKAGDQGGHYLAHRFLPGALRKNLFPQNAHFNNSAWKRMENEWADWTEHGMEVRVTGNPLPPKSIRPDQVAVSYEVVDPATGRAVYELRKTFDNAANQAFDRVPRSTIRDMVDSLA
ncbi:DNA/RNA non-specific endonuclease [Knoellia koreensis]|nr:DNA/RNA non-specific endonuclease [Knoellia sp. DB2414S]